MILTQRCIPGGGIPATGATERKLRAFQGDVAKRVQPLLTPMVDVGEEEESFRQQRGRPWLCHAKEAIFTTMWGIESPCLHGK